MVNAQPFSIEYTVVAQTTSSEETKRCAAALARLLRGTEVITLDGDLGAGKTHFTQGLAQGLGIKRSVTSPTFNVLVVYDEGRIPLYHFDLYRLEKPEELDDIAFAEYVDSPGISCIEWASKFPEKLPEERLEVFLEVAAEDRNERVIKARAFGIAAHELLICWKRQLAEGFVAKAVANAKVEVGIAGALEPDNAAGMDAEACVGSAETDEPIETNGATETNRSSDIAVDTEVVANTEVAIDAGVVVDAEPGVDTGIGSFVLAFDTANEMISIGLGKLDRKNKRIEHVASQEVGAFRASNEKLVPEIAAFLEKLNISREQIACVVCGRGPGSFTGVRICLAVAKGLAIGLGVALFGVSTADSQAWQLWLDGVRGPVLVLGDAMRKEIYPVRFELTDEGVTRLNADIVIKAEAIGEWLGSAERDCLITGDALKKYEELCQEVGMLTNSSCWYPQGRGLLRAAQDAWKQGVFDPDNKTFGNPCTLLPVYTRLSDAEEHERIRFAKQSDADSQTKNILLEQKNLETGVQGEAPHSVIRYQPLENVWAESVAALEQQVMGSDAWSASQIIDELPRADRTWWAAYRVSNPQKRTVDPREDVLVGYAGGWIVDGQVQILKIASSPECRRMGIARELITRVALDARDLGAREMTLEVRVSNKGAHAFYEQLGLKNIGKRPRYYSDKEDAFIYTGPLPIAEHDVAGMDLRINAAATKIETTGTTPSELILAIESSCDETAVALIDGDGTILSDVVASQIDFHSRFGGVVPEIASRKHIEAIGGVVEECLAQASAKVGQVLSWHNLSAVAVTYAPGLVGALVVGMAFAKGLAWAIDIPLIGVNHLEGHLYANKIAHADIKPPMVVSLVSGGHTMLVHVKDWGSYETMGTTLDDAVGEAFDKVAKAMGLGYPGGPIISKLAAKGNPKAVRFPRALMHSGDLQFSLSGLKTSVMTYLQKERAAGREPNQCDVAASFQAAVVDVQVAKARTALEQTGAKEFCLGGGVAANPVLRKAYEEMCDELGVRLTMPPLSACTDNAAMIALVALDRFREGKFFSLSCDVKAHVSLDEPY